MEPQDNKPTLAGIALEAFVFTVSAGVHRKDVGNHNVFFSTPLPMPGHLATLLCAIVFGQTQKSPGVPGFDAP